MMRVAGCSHGQTADLRVFESVTIVETKYGCRVKNFDRINVERLECGQSDSSAEQIVRMRRNGEASALMNDVADFACGFSLQIGQLGADTKKMPIRGGHLDTWENEEIVDRQTVKAH